MTDVSGVRVLKALKQRLETIKVANGYPITIKSVELNKAGITMTMPSIKLPLIEVIDGEEEYTHETSGHVQIKQIIMVRFVESEGKSDADMEIIKSCIVRCIYANSFASSHNAGVGLELDGSNTINYPRLLQCVKDINLVDGNRIWELILELNRSARTWDF